MMAHAQKPDFFFRRNGRVHLNRQGASVHSTTGSRVVRINGSNAGYTMFRGSVKSTGYPFHSPLTASLLLPSVTVCHHISTGLYLLYRRSGTPQGRFGRVMQLALCVKYSTGTFVLVPLVTLMCKDFVTLKVRPHRTRSAAAGCGLCPLRNVTF